MDHLGNELYVSSHTVDKVNGKKDTEEIVTIIYIECKECKGEVHLNSDLDWPDGGVDWEVCPANWESIESDVLDWINKTF